MGISFVEKYEKMSDDELVTLHKSNDGEAGVQLLRRYMGMIKARASVFYNGLIEMDDLVQEGIISFYLSIRSYEPSLSSFSTFARLCVDRGIIAVIRSYARKKHIPQSKLVSIDDTNIFEGIQSPEDILIDAENVLTLKNDIKKHLSKLEYKILMLYLHNYSRGEIAGELHTSEKAVSNALYRIKNKLKNI